MRRASPALLEEVFRDYPGLGLGQREDVTAQAGKIAAGFHLDRDHFYGTEEALALHLELPGGREATVTGRLDYLEVETHAGKAVIVDLKSSHYVPPDSRVREDFQLACYALLVFENLPQVEVVEGRLFLSRYGLSLPQRGRPCGVARTPNASRPIFAPVLPPILPESFATSIVPGTTADIAPGAGWETAPWSAPTTAPRPPPPRTERQARKLACQVMALEGARETRLALLKEYVKTRGPLPVGSGPGAEVFAFRESESEEIPAADFLRILAENSHLVGEPDLSELLTVCRTSRQFKHLRSHARSQTVLRCGGQEEGGIQHLRPQAPGGEGMNRAGLGRLRLRTRTHQGSWPNTTSRPVPSAGTSSACVPRSGR